MRAAFAEREDETSMPEGARVPLSEFPTEKPGGISSGPGRSASVTFPLGSLHVSGGVKVLVLLANGMAARGWRVSLLVPDYASASPFVLDTRVAVRVVSTGPSWYPRKLRQIVYYAKLLGLAGAGADLCLANYYLTVYCAATASLASGLRTKVLWYIQGYEAGSHGLLAEDGAIGRIIRYLLARLSYRFPVPVWCVSNWVKDRIGRPDATVVFPPALNLEVFAPQERAAREARLVIGTIGRQGETKGYGDFLAALRELSEPQKVHVLVVSPTPHEVPLPSNVSAEAVHATTEPAMAAFYRRCDVFVLPSRMEGFPLPPLEAMACGCAVVATRCGGVVEYAKDEVNSLLVPVRNPTALGRAIDRLCRDEHLRTNLSTAGVRTAGRFGRDAMVEHFVDSVQSEFFASAARP